MSAPDRILLTRLKYIGDVVLTTPVIHAVRERFPQAYIAYLAEADAAALLQKNPHLDEIFAYDFSRSSLIEQLRVMRVLRRQKFDVVVDLFSNPRSALLTFASGAPTRIGKEARIRGSLYTHRVKDDGRPKSAVDFHYQFVQPLGVAPSHHRTEIFLDEEEKKRARTFLESKGIDPGKPVVGLHPGATWPAKMWPWRRFSELAGAIRRDLMAQVVITQGPRDGEVVSQVASSARDSVVVLPIMSLRELAAVLSQLHVYCANDNGTMHIAVAVETKTVGIFGPGEENIWFPYDPGDGHIAMRMDVPCHPCHLDFCNRTGDGFMECMNLLTVEDVLLEIAKRV